MNKLKNTFKGAIKGALAGTLATAPMTISMALMRRFLPWWQQSPLPPHKVTSETLDAAGMQPIDAQHHNKATLVGHFGYGAVTGTLYPLVAKLPLPTMLKSVLYGVGVWAASYMGWLPAAGLLKAASKRPMARNALMVAAHAVWGLVTGIVFSRWRNENENEIEPALPVTQPTPEGAA